VQLNRDDTWQPRLNTGFIDLYLYRQWMRFEDMLDPE
jgi:hypothetical protein